MEPTYCPGTGEPEPGGLVSREAIAMARDTVTQLDPGISGCDIASLYDVRQPAVSHLDR